MSNLERVSGTSERSMETSRRESAARQIQVGIECFHKGQWDCAITLSAAAEKMLPKTDKQHIFSVLKESYPKNEMELNKFINWLKHNKEHENAVILEFEAVLVIARAITKFYAVYEAGYESFQDFLGWAHKAGHFKKDLTATVNPN